MPAAAERGVLAPSDLRRRSTPSSDAARVGGRVVEVSAADHRVVLADALYSVPCTLTAPPEVLAGELVVVEGRWDGRSLLGARVVERHPGRLGGNESEHGRLASRGVGRHLAARGRALAAIRAYFAGEGFIEVDTPVRVRTPGLDAHVDAIRAEGGWLITSPEHHMKRLLAGGMPRIFQLARCSRAGERGDRHEPEFLMLEWYRAFSGSEAVMADTERLVAAVVEAVTGERRVRTEAGEIDLSPPFARLTVREAFREHAGVADAADLAASDEDAFFQIFVDSVEPALSRLPFPVFLHAFPISQAALSRPLPGEPSLADRFELFIGGMELCNGFGELTCPAEQRRRFEREHERRRRAGRSLHPVDERLLAALTEGMPPAGGNALGVDRLLMLALGVRRLGDVQAFPGEVG